MASSAVTVIPEVQAPAVIEGPERKSEGTAEVEPELALEPEEDPSEVPTGEKAEFDFGAPPVLLQLRTKISKERRRAHPR